MKQIPKFKMTGGKKNFVTQYRTAMQIEQLLKDRKAMLATKQLENDELLQQTQMGMQLMIKSVEESELSAPELLDGMQE